MASAQRWVFNLSHLICSPGSIKRSCDSSSPSGRYSHTHTDSASSYLFRGFVISHQIFIINSFLRNIIWVLCFPWAWSRFAKVFFSLGIFFSNYQVSQVAVPGWVLQSICLNENVIKEAQGHCYSLPARGGIRLDSN